MRFSPPSSSSSTARASTSHGAGSTPRWSGGSLRLQPDRQLQHQRDRAVRRTDRSRGSAADRSALSAGAAVVVRRRGIHDTRNDQLNPSGGHYLSANGQVAAKAIGSQVGLLKSYFTAQGFRASRRRTGWCSPGARGWAWRPVRTHDRPACNCRRASASSPAATPPFAASPSTGSAPRGHRRPRISGRRERRDHLERRAARSGRCVSSGWSASSIQGNVFKQTTDIDLGRAAGDDRLWRARAISGRTDSCRRRIQAGSPGDHPRPSGAAQRVAHFAGSGVLRS